MRAVLTGAFSNTGAAVAPLLLERGWQLGTLTNRPRPAGADPSIDVAPLRFDYDGLVEALAGADVLVNTYWVRFPHEDVTFARAVSNTQLLLRCAREAGVRRVVHVSIANPSLASPLGYYSGKALVEEAVLASGLSHAILRPTVLVGPNDVLSNNMAWFLRRVPVTAVPTGGRYPLQPITLDDFATIVADAVEDDTDWVRDVVGPETFAFREYLALLADAMGVRFRPVPVPPQLLVGMLALTRPFLHDTVLTRDELDALRDGLLASRQPAIAPTPVSQWLRAHADQLGRRYRNDTTSRFHEASRS